MKKLKSKIYKVKIKETEETSTTASLIEWCMDIIPQGGYTPKYIENCNRIQKVLNEGKEKELKKDEVLTFHFEDSDVVNLKEMVKNSKWMTRSDEITKFTDEVKNL